MGMWSVPYEIPCYFLPTLSLDMLDDFLIMIDDILKKNIFKNDDLFFLIEFLYVIHAMVGYMLIIYPNVLCC